MTLFGVAFYFIVLCAGIWVACGLILDYNTFVLKKETKKLELEFKELQKGESRAALYAEAFAILKDIDAEILEQKIISERLEKDTVYH